MAGFSGDNDDVQRVKERLDIVEIIGDRVRLQKAGRNYIGLCPFHNEKTPSFHVSPERQSYHCFGCGRGGDVFSFVMETEGLDFKACLDLLATRAGVELRQTGSNARKRVTGDLYEVMNIASHFFAATLRSPEGAAGRGYMQRRNLTLKDAEKFGLGWSTNSWDGLLRYLQSQGVPDNLSLESGLILRGQRGNFYDRFRGRLMFPIRDVTGRVIAFGGRLVDGEGAKYINSPEGPIYSKRRNLYLLHEARNFIREKKRCILVEGYMDALRLHLCDFPESVASLGTSLTEEQARLLKRFSDRCYICYDSDTAGQEATLRSMYILQNFGLNVYVISLPSGKDPDELLSGSSTDDAQNGRELFKQAIEQARPLILQHLHAVEKQLALPETRQTGRDSLMTGLVQLDRSAISPYLGPLACALGLTPEEFWHELADFRLRHNNSNKARSRNSIQLQNNINDIQEIQESDGQVDDNGRYRLEKVDPLEAALCSLLWQDNNRDNCKHDQKAMMSILSLLSTEPVKELALALMMESRETLYARWQSLGEKWPLELLSLGDAFCDKIAKVKADSDLQENSPWQVVCTDLKRRREQKYYKGLYDKMVRGLATQNELNELKKLGMRLTTLQ